ncbi:ribosome maturation factor RimP [uncultured Ilyobacter sp.]|uniref:ribosome maturation factor RimP n=1 Tax=uncultured Ilyobacter sp. TaxID=544433 RepID=UPI002AA838F2|nr:ribosome maturation factor RimP [uncultured Ilyobacter sp.]
MEKNAKAAIVEKIWDLTTPVASELGLDIVDIEYLQDGGYWYVRVYIEKPDAEITLVDCANVSNKIEEDVDALIDRKFFLEVSSPGIERPLKIEKDFMRFVGDKARLILKHKLEGSRNWTGEISSYENGIIYLDAEGKKLEIPFNEVKKANLVFEFGDF